MWLSEEEKKQKNCYSYRKGCQRGGEYYNLKLKENTIICRKS